MQIYLPYGILACLSIVYGLPSDTECCYDQIERFTKQCTANAHDVVSDIKKIATGELTKDEVFNSLELNCPLWLNSTVCDLNLTSVHINCWAYPIFEIYFNIYKAALATNTFFCKNNAEKSLELIANDGPSCLTATTPEEEECNVNVKNKLTPNHGNVYSKRNFCQYINGETECSKAFTACKNEIVISTMLELVDYVKPFVGCL